MIKNNLSFGIKIDYLLKIKDNFNIPKGFFIIFNDNITKLEFKKYLDFLKSEYLIIRSCANIEDSKQASFAGLFSSKIVKNNYQIIDEVKKLYNETDFKNINLYKNFLNIKEEIKLNFLIQEYIFGDYSGVYFSNYGGKEYMEYIAGQNSLLVDGKVTSSNITITKDVYNINYNKQEYIIDDKLNIKKYNNFYKLNNIQIKELLNVFRKIKKQFDFEIDIEWTVRKEKIYILQIRPITI